MRRENEDNHAYSDKATLNEEYYAPKIIYIEFSPIEFTLDCSKRPWHILLDSVHGTLCFVFSVNWLYFQLCQLELQFTIGILLYLFYQQDKEILDAIFNVANWLWILGSQSSYHNFHPNNNFEFINHLSRKEDFQIKHIRCFQFISKNLLHET